MPVGWMTEIRMAFTGTNAEFKAWLVEWERVASMSRHPAGKRIGRD